MSVYTLGIWLVHPGRENDFVQAWRDLARKTQEDFPHAKSVLMHDRDVRNRFISTAPWESPAPRCIGQWLRHSRWGGIRRGRCPRGVVMAGWSPLSQWQRYWSSALPQHSSSPS